MKLSISLFQRKIFLLLLGVFVVITCQAYAYRFVVYGDSRGEKGTPVIFNREILGAINAKISQLSPRPKFVFFLGDCVSPGWAPGYVHNNLVDWYRFMRGTLGKIPYYTVVGNNDLYGNTGWTEFPLQAQFQTIFRKLPSNGPPHYKRLAYTFEYGNGNEKTLFVVLDSFGFYKKEGLLNNFDNGVDREQLDWFAKRARTTTARYKFVLSHGPAFSIEGWPVGSSILRVWDLMCQNRFDGLFCAHEHIFSRWNITKNVYPRAHHLMTQTIVGSAGSPLDDISLVKVDFHQAHIYRGYTFVVVDVHEGKMVQKAYALVAGTAGYTLHLIDKYTRKK